MTKTKRSWYCSSGSLMSYAEAERSAGEHGYRLVEVSLRNAEWSGRMGESLVNFRDHFPDIDFDELLAYLMDEGRLPVWAWIGRAEKPHESGMKPNQRLYVDCVGSDIEVKRASTTQAMFFVAEVVGNT